MQKKIPARAAAFLVLAVLLLGAVSAFLMNGGDWSFQSIHGFYKEREKSLDAVYIGSSAVQKFWQAPLAWEHYGIAVLPFASSSQPIDAAEFMLREARKTQPDALYIISVNGLRDAVTAADIHHAVDYMPKSEVRQQAVDRLSDIAGIAPEERTEFYVPFLRYHSSVLTLDLPTVTSTLRNLTLNGMKSACIYPSYLNKSEDMTDYLVRTQEQQPPAEFQLESVKRLLSYCDEEKLNVLFVTAPQPKGTQPVFFGRVNAVNAMIAEHGYPVLDMLALTEEIGLDLKTDYYDTGHVNVHGSVKTTDYLARYLIEHYGFADKRGDAAYADWDAAYEKYSAVIAPYALPFEYEDTEWDEALTAPTVTRDGETLRWTAVEGADGYGIFRRAGAKKAWTQVATADADTLAWSGASDGGVYTVAAYTGGADSLRWGRYDILNVNG